jgi:hypothetical protein
VWLPPTSGKMPTLENIFYLAIVDFIEVVTRTNWQT